MSSDIKSFYKMHITILKDFFRLKKHTNNLGVWLIKCHIKLTACYKKKLKLCQDR